jgi:Domain of unknown function (DUF4397)/Sortase domain
VRSACGLFVVLAGWLLAAGLTAPPASAEETGLLRVAHLSPDSPAVDVAVTPADPAPVIDVGPDLVSGLGYGEVGAFRRVTSGSWAVSIRAAGSPRTTPPALSLRVELPARAARTLAISGSFADLALDVVDEDLSAPPEGSARVRVVDAAARAGSLDVELDGGPVLADGLTFPGAAPPVVVPAGPGRVMVAEEPGLPVDLAAGSVSTLLVLDRPDGGLTVRLVQDAAGPAVRPAGGVEAGTGGGDRPAVPVVAAALAGAAAGLVRRRGRPVALTVALVAGLVGSAPAPSVRAEAPAPVAAASLVTADAADVAEPVRLTVPSVGLDAPLTGIGLDGTGVLVPPADDTVAGWYRGGPAPGEPGPAVVSGHVDGPGGPAVFAGLRRVAVGDGVVVTRADGTTARFTVTRVDRYAKTDFPTDDVYGPTPGAELRLITCGGAFDRAAGSYPDNVVIYAS